MLKCNEMRNDVLYPMYNVLQIRMKKIYETTVMKK